MHFNLGLNVRHADAAAPRDADAPARHRPRRRASPSSPRATRRKEAQEAGADVVGSADLAKRDRGGLRPTSTSRSRRPTRWAVVGKLGRILGPRGLMPNPKTGTVTMDVGKAVRDAKAGKLEYRTDRGANVHVAIGKKSFDERAARRELRRAARRDRAREAGGREGPLHPADHADEHDGPRDPRRPVAHEEESSKTWRASEPAARFQRK